MKNKKIYSIVFILIFGLIFYLTTTSNNDEYDPKNYDSYHAILSIDKNKMTIAPSNYDGDSKEVFKDKLEIVTLNEDAKYYGLQIESSMNSEGDKKSKEYYNEYTFYEIKDMLENGFINAYLKYDSNSNVKAVLVYGETIYYN